MQQQQQENKIKHIKVKQLQNSPYKQDLEVLGKGQFGTVYRCYNDKDKTEQSVVKVIKRQEQSQFIIEQELQVLTKVPHHPNLVNFRKIKIESEKNVYLIMEYCNQGNLLEYMDNLNGKHLSEKQIRQFIFQFIQGYAQLYQSNIAHRDLKLENIMIHNNTLKIADFGLSFLYNNNTNEKEQQKLDFLNSRKIGTMMTMAPELYQISKNIPKNIDLSIVDVFSFGVIIYQLMYYTQEQKPGYNKYCHPYIPVHIDQIQNQRQFQEIVLQQNYPNFKEKQPTRSSDLKRFVSGLLEKDPNKRKTWSQIYQDPLVTELAYNDLSQQKFLNNIHYKGEYKGQKTDLDLEILDFDIQSASQVMMSKVEIENDKKGNSENQEIQDFEYCETFDDQKTEMIQNYVKYLRELLYIFDRICMKLMYLVYILKNPSEDIENMKKQLQELKMDDEQKSSVLGIIKNPFNLWTSQTRKENIQKLEKQVTHLDSVDVQLTKKKNENLKVNDINVKFINYKSQSSQKINFNNWYDKYLVQNSFFNELTSIIFYLMVYSQNKTEELLQNIQKNITDHFKYLEEQQKYQNASEKPAVYVDSKFLENYFTPSNKSFNVIKSILQKDCQSFIYSQELFIQQLKQSYDQAQNPKEKKDKDIQLQGANIILQDLKDMSQEEIRLAILAKCDKFISKKFNFTADSQNFKQGIFGKEPNSCVKNAQITFKYLFELEEFLEQGENHKFYAKDQNFKDGYNYRSIQSYFEEIENWNDQDGINKDIMEQIIKRDQNVILDLDFE